MSKFSRGGMIVLLLSILIISGCGGGGSTSKDPTIYIAGTYRDSTAGQYVNCYWTNSTVTPLTPGGSSYAAANSIFVSNSVIYTGGYYDNGSGRVGGYWTGTTFHPHPDTNTAINGIFVTNTTVYTNGTYSNNATPSYWTGTTKNASDLELHPGDNRSMVSSIYVANSIVYSGGSTYLDSTGSQKPCYWEGTVLKSLPLNGALRGTVNSIFVAGGKVYSCGTVTTAAFPVPCYWENQNNPVILSIGFSTYGETTGIYVANNKIYISGWYAGDSVYPCFWTLPDQTNPTVFTLPTGSNGSHTTSIFVSGSTPYIAGWYQMNSGAQQYPCYWNGITQAKTNLNLPAGITTADTAGIFVSQ